MAPTVEIAIVGAGPYGLALASRFGAGAATVFGRPMDTWDAMQPDMELRARWEEMSLAATGSQGSIEEWAKVTATVKREPMAVSDFVAYGRWFRERYVADVVEHSVESVRANDSSFSLTTAAGEVTARSLAIAVGITPFPLFPPIFNQLGDDRVVRASDVNDFDSLNGKRVAVVGGGQSAVEAAGYAARAGALVTLLVRGKVHWFADREPHTERSKLGEWAFRAAYPAVGYGPPPLNRLVLRPDLFALSPQRVRERLTKRLLRPGASPWLHRLVDDSVTVREGIEVTAIESHTSSLVLKLHDGTSLDVDTVLVATGHQFDLDRLTFLDASLRESIMVENHWPVLDRAFRSTNKRIFFLGYPAEGRFGPVARFVLGVPFTVERIARLFDLR